MSRREIENINRQGEVSGSEISLYLSVATRRDPFRLATVRERPSEVSEGEFRVAVARQFCGELSKVLTRVGNEKICTSECGEMRATEEWNFLCSAHPKPKECPAIEYMRHTVDQCTGVLLQGKNPSEHLGSILRRLYRILAHLYFHHEDFFTRWEEEHALCARMTHFLETSSLVSRETLIVPKSAFQGIAS